MTGKGGLSYEAALKTADEIVNHLFGTGMEDYELEFAEIVHWENRDTCRYVFAPVVSGLPLGSAAFTLDIRSQEEWGVSFQLYTVENIETPDLELVSFCKGAGNHESRFGADGSLHADGTFSAGNACFH